MFFKGKVRRKNEAELVSMLNANLIDLSNIDYQAISGNISSVLAGLIQFMNEPINAKYVKKSIDRYARTTFIKLDNLLERDSRRFANELRRNYNTRYLRKKYHEDDIEIINAIAERITMYFQVHDKYEQIRHPKTLADREKLEKLSYVSALDEITGYLDVITNERSAIEVLDLFNTMTKQIIKYLGNRF